MKLKSYHTASVEAAIRLAYIELGDDAVFLGSRRNDIGHDPGQAYEVTFALLEPGEAAPTAAAIAKASAPAAADTRDRASRSPASRRAENVPAAPDEGAFLSWKKLLRQVSSRGPRAKDDLSGGGSGGSDANGALPSGPDTHAADSNRTMSNRAVSNGAGSNGSSNEAGRLDRPPRPSDGVNAAARNGTLPHWKAFVPADQRDPAAVPPPGANIRTRLSARAGGPRPAQSPANAGPSEPPAAERPAAAHRVQLFETDERFDPPLVEKTPPSGVRPKAASPPVAPPPAAAPTLSGAHYSLEKLSAELDELRRMIAAQGAGHQAPAAPARDPSEPERVKNHHLDAIYRALTENAVAAELAAEIVAELQPAAEPGSDPRRLAALLAREIRGRLKTNSDLGPPTATTIVAVVGPSGAGKTTVVAKLAFRCGLLRRRRVRLLSVDQLRIGAVEPLQAYAELMNAPLEILDDFERFSNTLGAIRSDEGELVLIDTPGYGRREWERARRLAAIFEACGGIDVHLALDLRTKEDDLRRAIEQYRVFSPSKLIFTRLDETTTFGTMLNETVRTGWPLSFVSVGQRVPEDIVPAGEPELLRLLLKDRSAS